LSYHRPVLENPISLDNGLPVYKMKQPRVNQCEVYVCGGVDHTITTCFHHSSKYSYKTSVVRWLNSVP